MQHVDRHPKSGVCRVRVTFPLHLREILNGAGTTKSLGTKDATAAKRLAIPVLAQIQRRMDDAESIYRSRRTGEVPSISLEIDVGLSLLDEWRDDYLRRVARVMAGSSEPCGDYLALGANQQEHRARLDPVTMMELYYSERPIPGDVLDRTLDGLLSAAGYILPCGHRLRSTMTDGLRQAIATIRIREEQWRVGDWTTKPPLPRVATIPANGNTSVNSMPSIGVSSLPLVTPSNTKLLQRVKPLTGLLDAWMERNKPKAEKEPRLAVQQLIGCLLGKDPFAHEVSFEDAERFYDILKWLPKSMTHEMRKRPLADVAADMQAGALVRPRAAGATAAKKVQLLSAMFNLAVARGWASINPFARLVGKHDAKPETKRPPMRDHDLRSIFAAPLFAGCAGSEAWREPGDHLIANHRFWVPILALVTGMRIEEVGQLLVSDVRKDDGILHIHITEEVTDEKEHGEIPSTGSKSVKTRTSVRRVPLHRIALDAGFEEYWQWASVNGEAMLFPELPSHGKRTKNLSRWFNRDFRPTVGLAGARTFHSFRHLFKDRCRDAELRRDLHDALTGHADRSTGANYGDGLSLIGLKAGIDALTFPGWPGVPARGGPFARCPGTGAVLAPGRSPLPVCNNPN